jgi:hypothetical protein
MPANLRNLCRFFGAERNRMSLAKTPSRKVRKCSFFTLRLCEKYFRVLVAVMPRWVLRGELFLTISLLLHRRYPPITKVTRVISDVPSGLIFHREGHEDHEGKKEKNYFPNFASFVSFVVNYSLAFLRDLQQPLRVAAVNFCQVRFAQA